MEAVFLIFERQGKSMPLCQMWFSIFTCTLCTNDAHITGCPAVSTKIQSIYIVVCITKMMPNAAFDWANWPWYVCFVERYVACLWNDFCICGSNLWTHNFNQSKYKWFIDWTDMMGFATIGGSCRNHKSQSYARRPTTIGLKSKPIIRPQSQENN